MFRENDDEPVDSVDINFLFLVQTESSFIVPIVKFEVPLTFLMRRNLSEIFPKMLLIPEIVHSAVDTHFIRGHYFLENV